MFAVGVFYLVYEKDILASSNGATSDSVNGISRVILGAQVSHYSTMVIGPPTDFLPRV